MKLTCKSEKDTLSLPKSLLVPMLTVSISYLNDQHDTTDLSDQYGKLLKDIKTFTNREECFFSPQTFDNIKHALFIYSEQRPKYKPVKETNKKKLQRYTDKMFFSASKNEHRKTRIKNMDKIRLEINNIDKVPNVTKPELIKIRKWFNSIYINQIDPTMLGMIPFHDLLWGYADVKNILNKYKVKTTTTRDKASVLASQMLSSAKSDDKPTMQKLFIKMIGFKSIKGVPEKALNSIKNDFANIFINNYVKLGISFDDLLVELKSDQEKYLGVASSTSSANVGLGVEINPDELPEIVTPKIVAEYLHAMFVSILYNTHHYMAQNIFMTISTIGFLDKYRLKNIDTDTMNTIMVYAKDMQEQLMYNNCDVHKLVEDAYNISDTLNFDIVSGFPIVTDRRAIIDYVYKIVEDLTAKSTRKAHLRDANRIVYGATLFTRVKQIDNDHYSQIRKYFNALLHSPNKNNLQFRDNLTKAVARIDINLGCSKPQFMSIYQKYGLTETEKIKLAYENKNK